MPPRFVARRAQTQFGERVDEASADRPAGACRPARRDFDEFGPLAPLVANPAFTNVFVNGPRHLWADRGNGLVRASGAPTRRDAAARPRRASDRAGGSHIDEASPCVDVRLRDGIRVHAVLPPISTGGTLLSVRLPAVARPSVTELDAAGFFRDVPLAFVARLVQQRHNILITGASGSGKTALLAALLATAAPTDRIVAIEDVAELLVDHPHFVSLEARQANLEGAGAVVPSVWSERPCGAPRPPGGRRVPRRGGARTAFRLEHGTRWWWRHDARQHS